MTHELLLFRQGALIFNGHRIHCDRRSVTEAEGYPAQLVHGPLIATLLLHRQRPDAQVASFRFKALRPALNLHAFTVCGRQQGQHVHLCAQDDDGWPTVDASAMVRH